MYARRDGQDRSPDNIKRTGHLSDLILTVSVKEEASSRYYVAALWVRAFGSELATMSKAARTDSAAAVIGNNWDWKTQRGMENHADH